MAEDEGALGDGAGPETPARRMRLPKAFESLRHRNYRLLWVGTLISSSGDWMDQVALNWLVYELTDSAFSLGILNLCRLLPILLFTLIGGVVADRFERRRMLFVTQTVAMVLAFALAILVSTGIVFRDTQLGFLMVLVVAVGRGMMMSFNQPARQSLISDLVPSELLTNAVALNSATLNLTRVIGPVIGGLLIASIGTAGAFYFNGASFVAVLWGLALMRFPPRVARRSKAGIAAELAGGVRYVANHPQLRTLVVLALVPMIFGMPYMTMLTVFARDVLFVGGTGLGVLTAASGRRRLRGAVRCRAGREHGSPPGDADRAGLLRRLADQLLAVTVAVGVGRMLTAAGFSQQVYMALNNTLIQEDVDPEYRGRVISTLFLNRGFVPMGTMIAGFGADAFGAPLTIGAMASVLVLLALVAARLRGSDPSLKSAAVGG